MRYNSRWIAICIAFTVFFGTALILRSFIVQQLHAYELPTEKLNFANLKPISSTEILDRFGKVLTYKQGERLQIYKSIDEISPELAQFVVFNEDAKFFTHNGFDVDEIKNSIEENIEKGKVKRGASTITQQLAKNLFLDKQRSWKRKLFEVPWTLRLEKDFSKKQLLDLYLNIIEWGPGIYGAEAASRHFFDRSANEIDTGQAMYLALIIPNPVRFDLLANPSHKNFLEKKKTWMVNRLIDEKRVPAEEKNRYLEMSFGLKEPSLTNRRFALTHKASYIGSRNKISKNHYRNLLEGNLAPSSKKSTPIPTTLDGELLDLLENLPLKDAENVSDRFFIVKEANLIRSFRFLAKNKGIDRSQLPAEFCDKNYSCEELPQIDWKNLAP